MSYLPVRLWTFDVGTDRHGNPMTSQAQLLWQRDLPLDLARMTLVNALGSDSLNIVNYQAHQLELRLLLSYVSAGLADEPFNVQHHALRGVSGHIRRFVSEATGMSVLSGASAHLLNWPPDRRRLANFDVLPAQLAGRFRDRGVRPDLLFFLGKIQVAGEARGRVRHSRKLMPQRPLSDQWRRLDQLAAWSRDHHEHPYFMSWAYIGSAGVAADVFFPRSSRWDQAFTAGDSAPGPAVPRPSGTPSRPRRPRPTPADDAQTASQADDEDVPEEDREWGSAAEEEPVPMALSRPVASERAALRRWVDGTYESPLGAPRVRPLVALGPQAWEQAAAEADEIAGRLYETAPGTVGDVPEGSVKGTWALADLRGPAQHRVLLAVLPSSVRGRRELTTGRDAVPTSQMPPGDLQVAGQGRFAVAISPADRPAPSWAEIEAALTRPAT